MKKLIYLIFGCIVLLPLAESIENDEYKISPDKITKKFKIDGFVDIPIIIENKREKPILILVSLEGSAKSVVKLEKTQQSVEALANGEFKVTIFGKNISKYDGFLVLSGDVNEKIPINITVTDFGIIPVEAITMKIDPVYDKVPIGGTLKYKVDIQNLLSEDSYNVTVTHSIDRLSKDTTYKYEKSFFTETDNFILNTSISIIKEYSMPDFIRPGDYVINVKAIYLGLESSSSRRFAVKEPFLDYLIFGILPVRWLFLFGSFILIGIIAFLIYKKRTGKKKRYASKVDFNLLPKPGPRAAYIGKIADTTKKTYFDLDQLTTHTLVAGSTGGGKTVSCEVMIEEALLKGSAIIVFDPTAQWTGMLRKCTEKKMLDLYSKFGMKKTEARAFNGNVKSITNAREIIDIKKFIKPGEINVFSISKLDPEDADILVSNTIRGVFHAGLPEASELKLVIIFDEVHRLLPKFGGSGQGFIQIERACREFRKWGVGLVLISQVLTDFVGETKANINTEIQMRTRDQGDLDRIKSKYGGYMLQSLLKASTGTGMMENSAYNRGNPYFVAFRPLLHEHARLTDEELDNYNKYNDIIDDLEFQIEQLEQEGLDVFDLKLELKMALDKVKSGSFNMVNIYLEGLRPRIKGQWDKLGKEPKKRVVQLVSEDDLKAEFEKAQKARKDFEKKEEKKPAAKKEDAGPVPLRLKSGIMVGNKNELIDALESMDDETFNAHVTDEKNDFADWLEKIDKPAAEKIAKLKSKKEMSDALQAKEEEK